jgi:hypothetical protein
MTNLLELADRVEAGEGADRLLDGEIAKALAPERDWHLFTDTWGARCLDDTVAFDMPPHLTASLDVALTLVPEGCAVDLTIWFGKNRARVLPCHKDDPGDRWLHRGSSPHFTADASTPARALTAACLRARAEMGK